MKIRRDRTRVGRDERDRKFRTTIPGVGDSSMREVAALRTGGGEVPPPLPYCRWPSASAALALTSGSVSFIATSRNRVEGSPSMSLSASTADFRTSGSVSSQRCAERRDARGIGDVPQGLGGLLPDFGRRHP